MDRLRVFKLLERAAQPVRRAGLGRLVDRVRRRFERGFGTFTAEVDGLRITGRVALHVKYIDELREGDREGTATRLFVEASRPGSTVLDIGAHLGWLTMQAARRVGPTGRVVAFEPNPETRPLLEHNLRDNGFADRVTVVPKAVGATSGRLVFFVSAAGDTSSLYRQDPADAPVEVELVAADDELDRGPSVSAVKIDVEGGELAALAGIERTVRRAGPGLRLLVECNPSALEKAGTTPTALWARLVELGLEPKVVDEHSGTLRGRGALGGIDGYANLFCSPVTT